MTNKYQVGTTKSSRLLLIGLWLSTHVLGKMLTVVFTRDSRMLRACQPSSRRSFVSPSVCHTVVLRQKRRKLELRDLQCGLS